MGFFRTSILVAAVAAGGMYVGSSTGTPVWSNWFQTGVEKTKPKQDRDKHQRVKKQAKKVSQTAYDSQTRRTLVFRVLKTLKVKGRAPMTGYDRNAFGSDWPDVDDNGCDTRNDILARDLFRLVFETKSCIILTGTLKDRYSGKTIHFVRGTESWKVQIDHVVALADAWQKGAQQWTPLLREQFANDPLNLKATDGSLNAQKGAGDAATWLPPNRSYRCAYVARQVAVKANYRLSVTLAEKRAIQTVLAECPNQTFAKFFSISQTKIV